MATVMIEENLDALPPERQKEIAVKICSEWFEKDRNAKRFYMDEMREMYKIYNNSHWSLIGPDGQALRNEYQQKTRPNSVENYTFALIEGQVAEFCQEVELIDLPMEPGDERLANIMTNLKKFILYKNKEKNELPKFLRHLFLYGTGIRHPFWDNDWRGGRGPNKWVGDIRFQALHPRALFPDARCGEDINNGRRVHKAVYKTIEELIERYPHVKSKITADIVNRDMLIGDESEDGSYESQEDLILVVETWYKGEPLILDKDEENKGPGLHIIWWAGENNPIYLNHANYVMYEPGETVEFPFIVKQCYPRENSIWGYGEAYYLKNPQITLNKTAEIILEGHIHQALGQTVFDEGALTPKQRKFIEKYGSLAGMWFPVKNVDRIKKFFPTGIPASLQNEVLRLQKAMEAIIGRFDVSQGKTPGSVTAFQALRLLAARAQVRLRSKELAITSAYEEAGKIINILIEKNYTEKRRYRILGENYKNPEYGVFKADDLKKVYIYSTGDVIPYNEFVPTEWMKEGEDYEVYSPEFDVICKVTTVAPVDKVFYMEMAKELFITKLIDAETFWYVMEHGKFPPYEKLRLAEVKATKELEQQEQQEQEGIEGLLGNLPFNIGGQGQEQSPSDEELINNILERRQDLREQLNMLPPEERGEVIKRAIEGSV